MDKRTVTRARIIQKAREIFLKKGLIETSMGDVAAIADCHRRTLYRYFPQKEDLVYETVISFIEDLNVFQREIYENLEGTGHNKFKTFLKQMSKYMETHKPMVRFMGEFDSFFKDDFPYNPGDEILQHFTSIIHITEDLLALIIKEGQRDGSIVLPYSKKVFIPVVTSVLWAMAQRIAIRETMIEEEFEISAMDMVSVQIDIYCKILNPAG